MYYPIIHQCSQALMTIEVWLDKAEQHAGAKKLDVGVLMTSRLAADMREFIYQVQSACDYVKGAAAWLPGQTRHGTQIPRRRSTNCVLVSARPSPSRRA
jgi:hypothetical protein